MSCADRPRRDNEDDSKVCLPNARRSAAAAAIASAQPEFEKARHGRRKRRRNPASASPRWCRGRALPRAATPRNGSSQGRVTVNGRVINSPALDVTANDVITVDGKPLPPRERTRLFMFHKPRGLMTTHADPEGRPTVFDNLPEGLPRLILDRPASISTPRACCC